MCTSGEVQNLPKQKFVFYFLLTWYFWPSCTDFMCVLRCPFWVALCSQCGQLNFWPSWTDFMCVWRLPSDFSIYSYVGHEMSFSIIQYFFNNFHSLNHCINVNSSTKTKGLNILLLLPDIPPYSDWWYDNCVNVPTSHLLTVFRPLFSV